MQRYIYIYICVCVCVCMYIKIYCLQGGSKAKVNLQIRKAIRKYPSVFEKFNTTPEDVIRKIINHDEVGGN